MALKTVSQLKDSVAGLLQGVSLNNITNLNNAIERATRTLVTKVDILEASGRFPITLYNGVYDYEAPSDIFGGVFYDLRPQNITRTSYNYVYRRPIEMFDRTKLYLSNGTMITFESNKGIGIMRVVETTSRLKTTLDTMTETTGWTASGNASGLTTDLAVYYQSPACIRFNLASSGSQGILTKTISSVDLTDYEGVGVVFLAAYLPSATAITSITLRIGSSASNYFSVTATEGQLGTWNANEWTLIPFDLSTASETGTVDIENVDYVQLLTNYDGTALTNVRFGSLFIAMPSPYELLYGSSAIFKVSGTMSNNITTDNDEIVLNDAAYLLLEYECALTIALQFGGGMASPLVQSLKSVLHGSGSDIGLYAQYRADNPSQELRMVGNWYDDERQNY